jgi:hypothetical protein
MTWTFVQAPLGATETMLFVWRLDHGVIYLSRAQFRRIQGNPELRDAVERWAWGLEANFWGFCHVEYRDFADTNECVNAQAIARWLDVAAGHPLMREDAYIVFSLIARVDPDVEAPFTEWAEQLPLAI